MPDYLHILNQYAVKSKLSNFKRIRERTVRDIDTPQNIPFRLIIAIILIIIETKRPIT